MRILFNGVLMLLELAAIAAVAWLGLTSPLIFAAVTAALALALGIALEMARLRNEIPFYFERTPGRLAIFTAGIATVESLVKAVLGGVVALLTFLGTDQDRLQWVAVAFAVCLFIGIQTVRVLSERFRARPMRWGYFRLAAPLGLLFSLALSFLPAPGLSELAHKMTFELPNKPTMAQASEFLFLLKQSFDDIVVRMLSWVFEPAVAQTIAAVASVNVLSGFVLALYSVIIADVLRRLDAAV